jgi:ATP-binding cassette subfamily B protein
MSKRQIIIDQKQARRVVRFLFGLGKLSPRTMTAMGISQVLGTAASTAIAPLFVSRLLTRIANGTATMQNSTDLLIAYALSLFIGEIVSPRISIWCAYMGESRMQQRTAERILENQMQKSLAFHANRMSGGIVSDATKLNSAIERFWDTMLFTALPIATTVVSVCIALLFFVWQYSVVLLVISCITAYFIIRAQSSIAPISRKQAEKSSASTAYFADVIANISVVKAFAGGAGESRAYHRKWNAWRDANQQEMRKVLLMTGAFSGLMTLMNLVAFVGAVLATQYHLAGIGTTYLIISYTLNIVSQLWQINSATRNYVRIIGDAGPMIAMLGEAPELTDPQEPETVRINRGDIRLRAVTFRHDGADTPLFDRLELHIKPGEKVGLVGHSGSGKTTLTRVLLRFSDIQGGAITIDGQNIAAITQDDLRRHIAYVPQEPLLFHRSIRENIGYGTADTSQEAIESVARMASAHDFITQLPQGYGTLVGERGVKLSGGQRQRIAIARALLKNAPILVLDEATSALDSESEVLIQQALWKLMENRTAIVVAHRLSTIQKMDRIIVLDHGRIVEEGSHKELVGKKDGTYAKLWAHQSGGFIEE